MTEACPRLQQAGLLVDVTPQAHAGVSSATLHRVTADLLAALSDEAAWAQLREAHNASQLLDEDEEEDGAPVAHATGDHQPVSGAQSDSGEHNIDKEAVRVVVRSIEAHPLLGSYLLAHCVAALDAAVSTMTPQQDALDMAAALNTSLQHLELAQVCATCRLACHARIAFECPVSSCGATALRRLLRIRLPTSVQA